MSHKKSKKYKSAPSRLGTGTMFTFYNNYITNIKPQNIIEKRISNYDRVQQYLSPESDLFSIRGCLVYDEHKLYIRNDKYEFVVSDKPITKGGSFGVAYTVDNEIVLETAIQKFKYALKIQIDSDESANEVHILQQLTKKLISDKNIHLPIIYANFKCNDLQYIDNSLMPGIIKKHRQNYTISMVELGNGDFKQFVNSKFITSELFVNAVAQIFMCILSLHKYGISHNDAHWGNFLYFKIKSGGYFQYVIDGKNYYVENLGYLWISWDFGVSHKLYRNTDYIYDYGLFALFLRHYTPNNKNRFYDVDVLDENGFIKEDAINFRYFGNLPETVKIPIAVRDVDKYIISVMSNDNIPDGGKFENSDSEIPYSQKLKIKKTLFPTISEKMFITNIIDKLKIFRTETVQQNDIISNVTFDNLVGTGAAPFSMSAFKTDMQTRIIQGTQNFVDL